MSRFISNNTDRNQISLIPSSLEGMISQDNPVRVIDLFADSLDLNQMGFRYATPKAVGRKPYNPADLLKLYLYGYFNGIRTSRKLENECKRNIELMWLLKELTPDYRTIADFRKDNISVLKNIFQHFSVFCNELGLFGKEIVAIDGSKFRANNARKKNLTKGKVAKMLAYFEQSAARYLELLEHNDDLADASHVAYSQDDIKQKLAKVNQRIQELTELKAQVDKTGEVSLTDQESRLMSVNNMGFEVAYNMQTAVDAKNHLIVAVNVTNNPADQGQLHPMAIQAKEELATDSITVLADKGYYAGECLRNCEQDQITAIVSKQNPPSSTGNPAYTLDKFQYDQENDWYICPQGQILPKVSKAETKEKMYRSKACKNCPHKKECTKNKRGRQIIRGEYHEIMARADERLARNMTLYKQRQMIVEHPFGTIKRTMGYTYFLLRGIEKVHGEAVMHCLMYNLKRVLNILGTDKLVAAIRKCSSFYFQDCCCFSSYSAV
ncbi:MULTISPECIES: IS1182 family transposase [Sporomusa]|jgi:transposase/IS5 family transposase|uniref:Transposase DDE domain protein n=2 Tax=Sporomusa TaxID=2375 RepID=A0ABM9W8G8_9FIRM|nr:IS1182 family transposase [Sporomusa sphaeroides]OLS58749.1 transposase DDE domain protein [Sporomusa sphaeroides DSM 2875]CVK21394.1 Transposase DDE domain protein [Sporomusa sphaeroides DSM 2875]SCM79720.1 transposase [uncultured Sporomusa sp.]HML35305.1 IS1182 family transposase [Sporomusa sphaeroides]